MATTRGAGVAVLLGQGDAKFSEGAKYLLGGQTKSVALGDLNGDGVLDQVTANSYYDTLYPSVGWVSVVLGRGDGTFETRINVAMEARPDRSRWPTWMATGSSTWFRPIQMSPYISSWAEVTAHWPHPSNTRRAVPRWHWAT